MWKRRGYRGRDRQVHGKAMSAAGHQSKRCRGRRLQNDCSNTPCRSAFSYCGFHTAPRPRTDRSDAAAASAEDCAVDWSTSYPGYETDLRAQRTSQKHSKSDLSTAPHCNPLNTPLPAVVAKKRGGLCRTSSSQSSAVLCRGFWSFACDMCESATGLKDGLTHSAANGLRVDGILLATVCLSGVCDCCEGSAADLEKSSSDKLATA